MTIVNDSEVLGHEPEPWRPGRTTKIVAVLLVFAAALAMWVDRDVRADETAELSNCSATIDAAIATALAPVDAMANYVSATRAVAPNKLTRELNAMVAARTAKAPANLKRVEATCSDIEILGHHGAEKARQRDCLARLEVAMEFVDAVARDGSVAFQARTFDGRSGDC